MRPTTLACFLSLLAVLSLIFASNAPAAEQLKVILEDSGWSGIIGTWVDEDSQGEKLTVTYAWKIKDHVIEVTTQETNKESVALMGVNGKNGDVFHVGADSEGTSFLGKWEIDHEGDAVLGLFYSTADGKEGELSVRHHSENNDKFTVTVELPDPIKLNLVRAASRSQN